MELSHRHEFSSVSVLQLSSYSLLYVVSTKHADVMVTSSQDAVDNRYTAATLVHIQICRHARSKDPQHATNSIITYVL